MVIMNKNLTLINYDLMVTRCQKCSYQKQSDLFELRNRELYFCSRNKTFIKEYKKHGEKLCLKCFADYIVKNINLDEYEIWQIN